MTWRDVASDKPPPAQDRVVAFAGERAVVSRTVEALAKSLAGPAVLQAALMVRFTDGSVHTYEVGAGAQVSVSPAIFNHDGSVFTGSVQGAAITSRLSTPTFKVDITLSELDPVVTHRRQRGANSWRT